MSKITTAAEATSPERHALDAARDAEFDLELRGSQENEVAPRANIYACCCCCCG